MNKFVAWALLLAACLSWGAAKAQPSTAAVDPVWGQLANLAGKSTRPSPSVAGRTMHWAWQVPGRSLVQELRDGAKVVRRDVITPGDAPGTLELRTEGFLRGEHLTGTVQADGSVLFRNALKQYVARHSEGAWELRFVEVRDGRVEYLERASRYPLDAPVAVTGKTSADARATTTDVARAWGAYARLAGHTALSDTGRTKARWYWVEPGRVLVQEYRRAKDDALIRKTTFTLGSEPGTLLITGVPVGLPPDPIETGLVQPDGSIYSDRRIQGEEAGYVAGFVDDRTFKFRPARLEGGRVVPNEQDDRTYITYRLDAASREPVAGADGTARLHATRATTEVSPLEGDHKVLRTYPSDGSIPELAIGQEAAGTLGPSSGARGPRGGNVPVGLYRFSGKAGQRICARVDSPDARMHVYLSRSPDAVPFASSWTTGYDHKFGRGDRNDRAVMFTLPATGEYYLYSMAHVLSGIDMYDKYPSNFYYSRPASSGRYELKLWDADRPEPPSLLPTLAKGDEADSGDGPWLGELAGLIDKPFVDSANGHTSVITLSGDSLLQVSRDPVSGREYRSTYVATGRRGEFVDRSRGQVLQATCGGTWTVSGGGIVRHYWMAPAYTQLAAYEVLRRAAPHAVPAGEFQATEHAGSNTLSTADAATIAMILESLQLQREIDAENAANRARYAAEDRANQQAMAAGILGGFAGGLAEEAADQQYAQEEFEHAVAEGQRQGLAQRAARFAGEAAAAAKAGAAAGAASTPVAADAAGSKRLPGVEAGDSATAGGGVPSDGEDASSAPATVLFAKGFQVPITPDATSNEMCFALVEVGPVTTGDGREGEAKRAAGDAEQRFLAACRDLGALTSGDFADEWYVDEKARSAHARLQGNRWMHEVDID